MAAKQPFWKWHCWKSTGFFPYTQVICYWSLDLIFKAKLKLESGNWKIQYGRLVAILKLTYLKINRLWPMATNNMHIKFEIEIPKQTPVTPENYANHRVQMCQWSLDLIFKAKLKLESGNRKIQYGHQAAILKVTSLKINRLLPIAINKMHMKFEIEVPKQTWVTLRKPCRLQMDGQTDKQTDRQTDGQTDGQDDSSIPPPTSLGGGIMMTRFVNI